MDDLNQHISIEKQYYEQMMSQKQFVNEPEEVKLSEERPENDEEEEDSFNDVDNQSHDMSMEIDQKEFDLNYEVDQICSPQH